jgi:hypothetical protein
MNSTLINPQSKNILRRSPLVIFAALMTVSFMGCRSVPITVDVPITGQEIVARLPSTLLILDDLDAQERIMRVFAHAYPGRITDVSFIDNDWTMLVNGRRFFFANGRFLPEFVRARWLEFEPYDFYVYPWVGTIEERLAIFDNPVRSVGSSFLFDALYFSETVGASWEQQVTYSFLGVKMLVHNYIAPLLDRVQERIRTAIAADPAINEWIAELRTTPPNFGWDWRYIYGTNRRSLHSYGIALDFLPRDLRGRHTYWQWSGTGIDFDNLWLPPLAVIEAFREYGFLWGGNWNLIDTMHFEYRPEILLLNGFTIRHLGNF